MDVEGRIIRSIEVSTRFGKIDISQYADGLYFVDYLENNISIYRQKIIVKK